MSVSEDASSLGGDRFPTLMWQVAGAQGAGGGPAVPVATVWVVTSIFVFYYGGSTSAQFNLQESLSTLTLVNWRPETASDQSLYVAGWQVFLPPAQFQFSAPTGQFDFRVCGWSYGAA